MEQKARLERKNATLSSLIKEATGGNADILPIDVTMARATQSVWNHATGNQLGQMLVRLAAKNDERINKKLQRIADEDVDHSDLLTEYDPLQNLENSVFDGKGNFVVYVHGKPVRLKVSQGMTEGLKAMLGQGREISLAGKNIDQGVRTVNSLFKAGITGYNPVFTARNLIRDIQDGAFNSKHPIQWAKNYLKAYKEIINNSETWQEYQAMGGKGTSYFDYGKGEMAWEDSRGAAKVKNRIQALNSVVEQAPRLAEYMASVKAYGNTPGGRLKAVYDAAEVTTNFGRSGDVGRYLNSVWVPFFNPSVQGTSKVIRKVTENRTARDWLDLAMRLSVLGFVPRLLNELLYHDDEEYAMISDRQKDRNFLFRLGDSTAEDPGLWLKIPRGRVVSVIGAAGNMVYRMFDQDPDTKADWAELFTLASEQIAPVSPMEANIFRSAARTKLFQRDQSGETWYGSEIDPEYELDLEPWQRYDETTTVTSRLIGKAFNLSPRKLDDLFDSYGGVTADILMPLLDTDKTTMPFANSFTLDPVYSNDLAADIADLKISYGWAANDTTLSQAERNKAKLTERYLTKATAEISDLYDEIETIKADSTLTAQEIQRQTREKRNEINNIRRQALANAARYEQTVGQLLTQGTEPEEAYREANRAVFGAEYALQVYDKNTYQRAKAAHAESQISYGDFYDYYFQAKDIKDQVSAYNATAAEGKTISAADRVREMLLEMDLNEAERQYLWAECEGNSATDINAWAAARDDLSDNRLYIALPAEEQQNVLYQISRYWAAEPSDRNEKASAAELMNIGINQYYTLYAGMSQISGSNRKAEIERYLENAGYRGSEKAMLMILCGGYSSKAIKAEAKPYVRGLTMTKAEWDALQEYLDWEKW